MKQGFPTGVSEQALAFSSNATAKTVKAMLEKDEIPARLRRAVFIFRIVEQKAVHRYESLGLVIRLLLVGGCLDIEVRISKDPDMLSAEQAVTRMEPYASSDY